MKKRVTERIEELESQVENILARRHATKVFIFDSRLISVESGISMLTNNSQYALHRINELQLKIEQLEGMVRSQRTKIEDLESRMREGS